MRSTPQQLAVLETLLDRLMRSSTLFAGDQLLADFVINPRAGALSTARRALRTIDRLGHAVGQMRPAQRRRGSVATRFHLTRYAGHAREIAGGLFAMASPRGVHLVISVGGDGTHSEVLSACRRETVGPARAGQGNRFFVRLPFGTGNDGADAPDIDAAALLLSGNAEPRLARQILVRPTGMHEHCGYNIASIGLDAYVAYLTNRLKSRFTGDLYKGIADVMTLFYERLVGAGPMSVTINDGEGRIEQLERVFLLFALGATGYRRYGGGKLVLPGEENLCAIETVRLLGKLRLKSLFYRGAHVHEPNVTMRSANRVMIRYDRRVPMQIDGESLWLQPENFPLEMTVHEPHIPVLAWSSAKESQ